MEGQQDPLPRELVRYGMIAFLDCWRENGHGSGSWIGNSGTLVFQNIDFVRLRQRRASGRGTRTPERGLQRLAQILSTFMANGTESLASYQPGY